MDKVCDLRQRLAQASGGRNATVSSKKGGAGRKRWLKIIRVLHYESSLTGVVASPRSKARKTLLNLRCGLPYTLVS